MNQNECLNGKKHGKWKEYFLGMEHTGNYVNGERQGKWEIRIC